MEKRDFWIKNNFLALIERKSQDFIPPQNPAKSWTSIGTSELFWKAFIFQWPKAQVTTTSPWTISQPISRSVSYIRSTTRPNPRRVFQTVLAVRKDLPFSCRVVTKGVYRSIWRGPANPADNKWTKVAKKALGSSQPASQPAGLDLTCRVVVLDH